MSLDLVNIEVDSLEYEIDQQYGNYLKETKWN